MVIYSILKVNDTSSLLLCKLAAKPVHIGKSSLHYSCRKSSNTHKTKVTMSLPVVPKQNMGYYWWI